MRLVAEGCNPVRGVEHYREQARERFLTVEELERIGVAILEAETAGVVSRAHLFAVVRDETFRAAQCDSVFHVASDRFASYRVSQGRSPGLRILTRRNRCVALRAD